MDHTSNRYIGFWDILQKRSVLLTATLNISMEDALVALTGVKRHETFDYKHIIRETDPNACTRDYDFHSVTNEALYLQRMSQLIE